MWSETALSVLLSLPPFPPYKPWEIIYLAEITKVPSACHTQLTQWYQIFVLIPDPLVWLWQIREIRKLWRLVGGGRKQKLLWCFSCSLCIWQNVPFKWLVHLFSGVLWAEWQQLPAVTKWEVTLSVSLRVSSSPVWSLSLHCKNPLRQKQGYSMKCFCD